MAAQQLLAFWKGSLWRPPIGRDILVKVLRAPPGEDSRKTYERAAAEAEAPYSAHKKTPAHIVCWRFLGSV